MDERDLARESFKILGVGGVVHVYLNDGTERRAVITEVVNKDRGTVQARVFRDIAAGDNPTELLVHPETGEDLGRFHLEYSEPSNEDPYTWHWPEKDDDR